MIKDLSNDDYCLNLNKLNSLIDIEQAVFAKIVTVNQKRTVQGDLYYSIGLKDKYGKAVHGFVFQPYAQKYEKNWNTFIGQIVTLICVPQKRYDSQVPTLLITGIAILNDKQKAEVQGELFEGVIPNLINYKNKIEQFRSDDEKLNKLYSVAVRLDNYNALAYQCDLEILDGCNGVYYVLFASVLDILKSYTFLTTAEIQRMMFTLLIVRTTMLSLSKKDNYSYNVDVTVQVTKLLRSINVDGDLYTVCIGYLNLCMGDNNPTSRLATILDRVYKTVVELYKFNGCFRGATHNAIVEFNGNLIKND